MTLFQEALSAMRGCWRLLRRDPAADEDFNLTLDGFWRSFAMVVPMLVLAYPIFVVGQRFATELAKIDGGDAPVLNLGLSYFSLLAGIATWTVVAAVLAWVLGVGNTYVRYMIIYNWMTIPAIAVALIPYLVYVLTGAFTPAVLLEYAVFPLLLYVSWYVARAGLQTTALIAFAFLLAEFTLVRGLDALIQYYGKTG